MKKNYIFILLLNVLLLVIFNVILRVNYNDEYTKWIEVFTIIIVLSMILTIVSFFKTKTSIISFSSIFIMLSYVFHLGQVLLYGLVPGYNYSIGNYIISGNNYIKETLLFSFNIIQLLVLFILLFTNLNLSVYKKKIRKQYSNNDIKKIGILICLITIPMRTIYNYKAFIVATTAGYVESLNLGFSGVYIQLSLFYIIGFVAILMAYSSNKKIARKIFIIELLYQLFSMLSGGRIYSVVGLLIIVYIYLERVERIDFKTILRYMVYGFVFLQLITVISDVRGTENMSIATIFFKFLSFENNIVFSVLEEFGGTVYSVIKVIEQVPARINYMFGSTYIQAIASVVPDMFDGLIAEIVDNSKFTSNLTNMSAYGGSYIGEVYYNFGYTGYLFTPVIAYYIYKLSSGIKYNLTKRNYFNVILYIMPIYSSLIWIRGYFTDILRAGIWGYIFIYFILLIHVAIKQIRSG